MRKKARTLAENALDAARSAGADEAEACVGDVRFSEIKVYKGNPEQVRVSEGFGIGVRVFTGGKTGFFNTCIPDDIERGVKDLTNAVKQADSDPCAGLPDPPAKPFQDVRVFDPELASLGPFEKIAILESLEAEALGADPRIVSSYFTFRDTLERRFLANTRGLESYCETTSFMSFGVATIKDERRGTRGFFYRAGRFLEDLCGLGKKAAGRAIRAFGGKPFPPRKCTVVYDSLNASQFLGEISSAFLGNLAVRDETFLSGKVGERVASSSMTIVDDLSLPGGPETLPFDGEGVPAQRTVLMEKGILTSYLYDVYWGRRAGRPSTGNGLRWSYRSMPGVSPSNFYVEPGDASQEEIIASIDDGVLLLETINVGGVDVASGDYSVAASGIRIEKGELTSPVGGITVAGKLQDMLKNIEAVGDDLEWHMPVASPTLAISGLTVGG